MEKRWKRVNNVTLMGRLVKNPELNNTPSGKVYTKFTLAVNKPKVKDKEQETSFIGCIAWGKTAEVITQWFGKGNRLIVLGRLDVSNKDGKYYTTVIVEKIDFIDTAVDIVKPSKEVQVVEDNNYYDDEGFPF